MIVEFVAAKYDDGVWLSCEISLNDDDNEEITLTIDRVDYRYFAEEMADGLALMLVRKEREG